ncbi:putative membrane protein [Nocardioides aromaticivorans]|uniref:Putative membrane protein n=1 Tax=Nocardioides aromaticivorans TaxID=200618 RepID=A0A7Y9ZJ98_9ACTN|nr:anthrone oxygenase family protein [Nocardioides aromaticivorans]NYI45876.1 putative membrane protein [Nocardioides aromaticivorans]
MNGVVNGIGQAATIGGTVTTGLVAGLFLAFSTAVMPGLARADDRTFVVAMQAINVAILNPLFLTLFVAPLGCLAVAALTGPARWWVVAALVLYVANVAITQAGNIPLNDALMAAGTPDGPAGWDAARSAFEDSWNRLHLVRTLALVASFACCVGALRAG